MTAGAKEFAVALRLKADSKRRGAMSHHDDTIKTIDEVEVLSSWLECFDKGEGHAVIHGSERMAGLGGRAKLGSLVGARVAQAIREYVEAEIERLERELK